MGYTNQFQDALGWYIFSLIVGVLVNLALCFKFAEFAETKGYSSTKYFWICFFFGVLGFVWVAGLPDAHLQYRITELENKLSAASSALDSLKPTDSSAHYVSSKYNLTNSASQKTTNDDTWICSNCQTVNSVNYGQCKKCGRYRSRN